jgi:L-alanine-DL-glutamate epimerase-like enolase superfamily enzyme
MRITDVRVVLHERKTRARLPFGIGDRGTVPLGVLSIRTDEGLEGTTFLSFPGPGPEAIGKQIVTFLKPVLVGRDPLELGALSAAVSRMYRFVDPIAIGSVDVALWDLLGRAAGMPVHRLLGTYRDRVPAYFSSGHHACPEDYAEEAVHWREQGWRGYKLHPPSSSLWGGAGIPASADIAACAAVREAVGDGMTLMLDAVWSYSYPEALAVGRAIEELGYYWYEDPLGAEDIAGYVRLKQQLRIPILATEITLGGLYALPAWLRAGATDFLRGDVVIKGGITGMMKIAHLAEAYGMNCEVHDAYNAMGNVASLHVIMAIPNCDWFEVITFDPAGVHDLEHLSYGLATPIEIDVEGFVHAPTGPGLGFDVDWELIDSAKLAELS